MDQERFETTEITETETGETSMVDRAKGAISDQMQTAKDAVGNLQPADNPMLMLLGGLAVGFLIGMLIPVSRFENEQLGQVADDLKGRVREAGKQAARRGGEVIKESIEAATESMTTSSSTSSRQGTTEY
jgi:phage tail tape-measure protein